MKVNIKIAELAGQNGFKNAYALQKALDISPTMAARLWSGEFKQIGIETIEMLCELFKCSPNDLFGYPVAPVAAPTKNTWDEVKEKRKQSKQETLSDEDFAPSNSSDNEFSHSVASIVSGESVAGKMLSTIEVAERLGVSRKSVNDYIIDGKLKATKGKQNHNFVRESDLNEFIKKS